jgi:formylglycine-generating enzyme
VKAPHQRSHTTLRWVLFAKAGAGVLLTVAFAGGWWLRSHGLTLGEYQSELKRGADPRFDWRSVDKRHWQALGPAGDASEPGSGASSTEVLASIDAREANGGGCAAGMVRVEGRFRHDSQGEASGEIERIQNGACTDWVSKTFPARCRTFDKAKIAEGVSKLPTRPLDFCMDRFEYPNVLGQNPMIVVTFHEAEALCKKSSKRLCTENEWTFACEGEEVRPYPNGWTRDATSCVIDRPWRPFAEGALQPRDGAGARAELDRLWQGEPSGSRGGCKSPFGVYDMTGNVDEWTRSARTSGYSSILKGGYWGPVRARCRPATRAHNEDFVAYQQGFRCCGEADTSAPRRPPAAGPAPPVSPPVAGPHVPDGGARPAADLSAEWEEPADDDDEVDAIRRARVGPACAVVRAPSPALSHDGAAPPAVLAAAGLLLAARLRRRRRPVEVSGPP